MGIRRGATIRSNASAISSFSTHTSIRRACNSQGSRVYAACWQLSEKRCSVVPRQRVKERRPLSIIADQGNAPCSRAPTNRLLTHYTPGLLGLLCQFSDRCAAPHWRAAHSRSGEASEASGHSLHSPSKSNQDTSFCQHARNSSTSPLTYSVQKTWLAVAEQVFKSKLVGKSSCFWHADKKTCLDLIWKDYEENGRWPQMLRHFYYVLLSSEALRIYPKTGKADPADQAYKWVSNLLVGAREQGAFPWSAIIDSGRRSFTRWRGTTLQRFSDSCQQAAYTLDPGFASTSYRGMG